MVSFFYAPYGYRRIGEKLAFNDAESKCREIYGTNLASIHSDEDYLHIVDVCGNRACYIGGQMTDKVNITWSWIDGSVWNYENWGTYNGIPQGQGLEADEKYTCIANRSYAQNGPRIFDCDGLQQLYPICNEPEAMQNNTSLSPSSEPPYFTPTIYYSAAPTLHPSTLPPSQISTSTYMRMTYKGQMSQEPLFWIFLVLFLIMTVVAVSFAIMYYRAKRQKTNQSQKDIVVVDKAEDSNTDKDEIIVTLTPNTSALQMVIHPGMMQYTHSGYDTSALLEDMYGAAIPAPSPKVKGTTDYDADGEATYDDHDHDEDEKEDEEVLKVTELKMQMTPTFDYDLEGQRLEDNGSDNVSGKNIVSTWNDAHLY